MRLAATWLQDKIQADKRYVKGSLYIIIIFFSIGKSTSPMHSSDYSADGLWIFYLENVTMDDIATRKQKLETRKQILHVQDQQRRLLLCSHVRHVQVQLRLQYNFFNNFFIIFSSPGGNLGMNGKYCTYRILYAKMHKNPRNFTAKMPRNFAEFRVLYQKIPCSAGSKKTLPWTP
jgi:hypothetical protein